MFRCLMTIIRESYPYLTKVTLMLKHSVKVRSYMYQVMWQHVVEQHMCCAVCTAQHTALQSFEGEARNPVFAQTYIVIRSWRTRPRLSIGADILKLHRLQSAAFRRN